MILQRNLDGLFYEIKRVHQLEECVVSIADCDLQVAAVLNTQLCWREIFCKILGPTEALASPPLHRYDGVRRAVTEGGCQFERCGLDIPVFDRSRLISS